MHFVPLLASALLTLPNQNNDSCATASLAGFHIFKYVVLTPSNSYAPTQADVVCFKALQGSPDTGKYPQAARWYKHIATFEDEFFILNGDATKPYTAYGPEATEITWNPANATFTEEDDDDVDLFGSDDEEEDAEVVRIREERLAEYRKKKEGKVKPAAKSVVTMDVKPWGTSQS
jgi:elongation factor 1-beta